MAAKKLSRTVMRTQTPPPKPDPVKTVVITGIKKERLLNDAEMDDDWMDCIIRGIQAGGRAAAKNRITNKTDGKLKFWEVRPLSKAAIKRALKLAKTITAYETAKKKVPLKLVIQFCETLDITEEAEPFDAKIRWPKPRRFSVANRSFSRLVQFESAYFGPKIEATRYADHEPKWLRSLSDRVSDRQIEESNFPPPRYSVTLDGNLLDSKPMVNERSPLVYDRPSGKWLPFTGTLREWQDALAITAEEAALCCIRPTEITSSVNAVQQPAAKGHADQSPKRGPLLTVKYPESDNSLPLMTVEYPDPYQWLPRRLWPALMRATPNSYATGSVKKQLRKQGENILRTEPSPTGQKPDGKKSRELRKT